MTATASRQLTVYATADIFAAGMARVPALEGGGGTLPPHVLLDPERAWTVSFPSVTGAVSGASAEESHSAEGAFYEDKYGANLHELTTVPRAAGISGIKVPKHCMCLVGVFLPATAQRLDAAPERLTFGDLNFPFLEPKLFQTFFIGDGRTDAGDLQEFRAPAGAARLFVGFACGLNCGGTSTEGGEPGYYDDNTGELAVEVSVKSPVEAAAAAS